MGEQLVLLRAVFANRSLRRLQLAWLATTIGIWGGALALSVYAYSAGGAAAVGLVAVLRTLPGAAVAPFLSALADRYPRRRIMLVSSVARAASMLALAAGVAAGAPLVAIYALVVVLALVGPAYGPAFFAMLPQLARTPVELSAANVAESVTNNLGFTLGSLGTGFALAATSPAATLALLGGAFLIAALPLLGVEPGRPDAEELGDDEGGQLSAGFRTVAGDPALREVALVTGVSYVIDGALDVLVVVAALGFLGSGEAGAGYLTSAWGVGAVAGGAGVMVLLGRGRLVSAFAIGAAVVGICLAVFAVTSSSAVAAAALVGFGLGYTLIEIVGATLLQRITPGHVLGRVAGVFEALTVAGIAAGSFGAALLSEALGARGALGVVAALLPVLVLVRRRALARLDSGAPVDADHYALLRGHEIFAPLPVATTEHLARGLRALDVPAGQAVTRQGEPGEHFYLVARGTLDVAVDDAYVRTMGPGAGFGEIALLRDVPRSATVRATSDAVLLTLAREDFLQAVMGLARSHRAAERVTDARLADAQPAELAATARSPGDA